ncbi:hypothetical protein IGM_06323 [Bacillus cereus HuB4-4]|uniref:Uncharacterized protein n=1 Tax=Bacillus cereus HuB4-4 TaxID=1053211 RepID=A0A9W5QNC7_BACCE|nr:hypothetical protein IGM_06323 [Bacillus cereus HuB4-4]
MSLETNIILSLMDVQLWMTPHWKNSSIKKKKMEPVRCLNKYKDVHKRSLCKFK